MSRWRVLVLAIGLLAACTKTNKQRECMDGTCTTPDFPFCDVTGFVSGEPGTCIAVTCTPNKFGECRGDQEVRCNAAGTNYDVVQCERGCDPNADGCRLCDPGETACTNGKVANCDSNGTVVSTTACPLGCFQDQPRCREIDPSNSLAMYFDMVPTPPDLNLENAVFDTTTGVVTDLATNASIAVPNFAVAAPPGGSPIRVFVANSVSITRAAAVSDEYSGPAFALLARGDIRITGQLLIESSAGGIVTATCKGGQGRIRDTCNYSSSAGGGGAFATNGAKGGDVLNVDVGGAGGIAAGNEKLVPLRGGCDGGGVDEDTGAVIFQRAGAGGGGVQLVSRTKLAVDGTVSVAGSGGDQDQYTPAGRVLGGGGAGGGILLEAPVVELGGNAQLLATGGDGATSCGVPGISCSDSGKGANVNVGATAGSNLACSSNGTPSVAGGGGGGLGRIRVNTASGTYTKASSAVEDGSLTTGTISTR